jgi:hypothetical protein
MYNKNVSTKIHLPARFVPITAYAADGKKRKGVNLTPFFLLIFIRKD